jgi:hypothetical protein
MLDNAEPVMGSSRSRLVRTRLCKRAVHAGEEQTCVRATKEERDTVPESASGTKASAQPMHSTAATAVDVFIAL